MAEIDFGGVLEEVITSDEFPLQKAREVLKDEIVAVIGYGVQGPGQAMNLRDNGIRVIVGQREGGRSWQRAVEDGFIPGKTLFPIEEAARKGTIIMFLLSDAGQMAAWPKVKSCLNEGDALYFSHGFSVVYKEQTKVIPPPNVDVIMVAPKGSGRSVRLNFLDGSGINSSFAVFQDFTGRAKERTVALGMATGSGYLFSTTFEKEVHSDLTGERGVLMGCLAGVMEALMLTGDGYVSEGSGDNIFIYRKGVLMTPPPYLGILEGITRAAVIDLARGEGITVQEAPFTRHDLYVSDECFLTGTAAEVIPVIEVDARAIGSGRPGPVTRRLMELFRNLTATEGVPL